MGGTPGETIKLRQVILCTSVPKAKRARMGFSANTLGRLHALLVNKVPKGNQSPRVGDLAGRWRIVELSELSKDYFAESDEPPFIEINVSHHGRVYGRYHFGLSDGNVEGESREFGGESVLVFGYEGTDEMDPAQGAGWLQLKDREHLTGEFLSTYGRFTAEREHVRSRRPGLRSARQ